MSERPNVLWIGVDQIRFDTLGINGNSCCKTPSLDKLAGDGVNFSRAYTSCTLCSPARASMFTGLYAFKHGMGTNCDMYHSLSAELTDPSLLLHPRFQKAGYRCAYAGKWHVGTNKGPGDFGFEGMNLPGYGNVRQSEDFKNYLRDRGVSYDPVPEIYLNDNEQTLAAGRWGGPQESTPAHYLADYTMDLMDNYTSGDQPFFVTCQFWGPHGPHMPSDEFYGMHNPEDLPEWENFRDDLSEKPNRIKRERDDFYQQHPKQWEEARKIAALYYDCTAMMDHEIGRILDWMEEHDLLENTIVVFSTDHGDMTASHGGLMDKGLLYQEAQHIPLIFYWKGHFSAAAPEDLSMNMDIMPTLLDFCGLELPANMDGISLKPAILGQENRRVRDAVLMEFHGLRFLYSQRAIVDKDNWKYIFTPGDYDEVYNLNDDPWEMHNLAETSAASAKIEELRRTLRILTAEYEDPLRDCVSKFFGIWHTGSGQLDATKFFDDKRTLGMGGV